MEAAAAAIEPSIVLEELPVGIVKLDADRNVVFANRAAKRLVNWSTFGSDLASVPEHLLNAEFQQGERWLRTVSSPSADGGYTVFVEDITEARRRAAEDRVFMQAVLDALDIGIAAYDASGCLRLLNRCAQESYPEPYQALASEPLPLRQIRTTVTGEGKTLAVCRRELKDSAGTRLGALVAGHDVTHRMRSAARLRHGVREFRALFNQAPVAYHEIDRDGIIRRVNRAELRLLERTREQMLGHAVWEFVSEPERAASRAAVRAKLAGERPLTPFEREYTTPSGRTLTLEIHETPITDAAGAIVGIRSALLDITDRKGREHQAAALAAERAARQQAQTDSAELLSILERIGDAYMAFDTDWRYTYVNKKAAELARLPASEMIGRCVWDLFPEARKTAFYTELHRSLREQIPIDFENYFAPLGKWFDNSVYPSPSGVGVFYRDVTDRVRTRQSLKLRTEELAAKNHELETFVSVASHDLQEPLRTVGGYASLLTKRYSNSLDEDGLEFLSYINHGVGRMQRLIKDLLALSRVGSQGMDYEDVRVAHVLDLVCGTLDLAIADSGASIVRKNLPVVRFNETHLMQLLQNLIGNALKYRREAAPRIVVSGERVAGAWIISVEDNGSGFDMQFAEDIFRPFRRLHRRDDGGTGIGLAICRKIVEVRGGRIWAQSEPGVGTTFRFTVPDAAPGTS